MTGGGEKAGEGRSGTLFRFFDIGRFGFVWRLSNDGIGEGGSGALFGFFDIGRFGIVWPLFNNGIRLEHFANDDSGASFPMNRSLLSLNSFSVIPKEEIRYLHLFKRSACTLAVSNSFLDLAKLLQNSRRS